MATNRKASLHVLRTDGTSPVCMHGHRPGREVVLLTPRPSNGEDSIEWTHRLEILLIPTPSSPPPPSFLHLLCLQRSSQQAPSSSAPPLPPPSPS
jgi:hypothetical protein